jgi:hypothetical protein
MGSATLGSDFETHIRNALFLLGACAGVTVMQVIGRGEWWLRFVKSRMGHAQFRIQDETSVRAGKTAEGIRDRLIVSWYIFWKVAIRFSSSIQTLYAGYFGFQGCRGWPDGGLVALTVNTSSTP